MTIYEYIRETHYLDKPRIELVLLEDKLIQDRNLGTHKKLYNKEEVEDISSNLIPFINELIEFLCSDFSN
ncbi:MAG: hypothetical protein P8Y70_21165 [Candidatus Lokiarchaeota archaeon]